MDNSVASALPPGNPPLQGGSPVSATPQTGHLKSQTVRGGTVVMAGQVVKLVAQTVFTAVLARLLSPRDFGLIAMITAFSGFMSLFSDMGLTAAVMQKRTI